MNEEDKNLLNLAGNAIGYELCWNGLALLWTRSASDKGKAFFHVHWNPLKDDAQAFRLAADLNLGIDMTFGCIQIHTEEHLDYEVTVAIGPDKMATIRKAIVTCAAELGRTMLYRAQQN